MTDHNTTRARFEGKVALVTGATSGIGRDTAIALAREGAAVVATGRRAERGAELVTEIERLGGRAAFVAGDVSDEAHVREAVTTAVDRFGGLHLAFNNAGIEGTMGPVTEQTAENYDQTFDINVKGVLLSMKHQIPAMLDTVGKAGDKVRDKVEGEPGGGAIVNNASIVGLIGMPGASVYIASKHAVIGLTKSAALEVAQQGIRVNAVAPGAIQTDMIDRFTGHDDDAKQGLASMHPIGRVGRPSEIVDAVLFLLSGESSFVTGHTLTVDGGFVAQ